jgi:hypothetical protein
MGIFKRELPSLVLIATYRVRYELLSADNLSRLTEKVREAINMKALSPMIVDFLPSPIFGTNAVSVNQPLMTSIMSLDSWPEIEIGKTTGAFMILVHSCQSFKWQEVHQAVTEFFPEANLLQKNFSDNTCRGLSYFFTRVKLWFLDRWEVLQRRNSAIKPAKSFPEVA